MKRLLLFILLFGVALIVLRQFEGPPPPEIPLPEPPVTEPEEEPETQEPEPERQQGMALSGESTGRMFNAETGLAVMVVESEDSRSLEQHDELIRVKISVLDKDSGVEQARINAQRARFRRAGISAEFLPEFEKGADLFEIKAVLLSGAPLVPMTFNAPTAKLNVRDNETRALRTDDHVTIRSDRFEANGDGFVALLDAGSVSLLANAKISFRQTDGEPVELSSRGPIDLLREIEPVEGDESETSRVQVDARDEATLTFTGKDASRLTAKHIRVLGRESDDDENAFLIERMEADGEVAWISGDTTAGGERAVLEFGPDGKLTTWRLEGEPSIAMTVTTLEGLDNPPFDPLDAPQRVTLTGAGPLTGEASGIRGFKMQGPAIVEAQDATLSSAGEISGEVIEEEERAWFRAKGGVLLESDRDTLETADLRLDFFTHESGEAVQSATARGGTRLRGKLADGRDFTVTSPEGLEVERTGEHWRVVEARRVVAAVEGKDGFRARADLITDFDATLPTLTAEGNVSVEGAWGTGTGERLVVEEADHFRLEGTAEKKAVFDHPDGRAEAIEVTVLGNSFEAKGEVDARMRRAGRVKGEGEEEAADENYHIKSAELTVTANEEVNVASGTLRRDTHLEAKGSVDTRITRGPESTTLRCDLLTVDRFEKRGAPADPKAPVENDEANLLEAVTNLSADGNVEGFLSLEDSDLDIDSGHLDVDRREGGDEENYLVTATQGVRFDLIMRGIELATEEEAEEGEPKTRDTMTLSGEGERFTLDESLSGTLTPAGSGRVRLIGNLLSQNAPFELLADRLEFTGARTDARTLDAWNPELVIWTLDRELENLPFEATGLLARAKKLEATPESLDLIDNVLISGATPGGDPWSLAADHIRLRGQAAARVEETQVETLFAEGDVEFRLGTSDHPLEKRAIATASGEALRANSIYGTLRLEGTPARVTSPVTVSESEWIEFDPELRIIAATGAGRVFPIQEIGQTESGEWELEFLASETRIEPDSLIYVIEEPLFRYPQQKATLHATWALFWVDRSLWASLPDRLGAEDEEDADSESGEKPPHTMPPGNPLAGFYEALQKENVAGLVREIYLEGPVEVLEDESLTARAGAVYSNVETGEGWLVDARFNVAGDMVDEKFERLAVHADWVQHASDGSVRASGARISTSQLDSPGVCLVSGDMRAIPSPLGGKERYRILLRDNRVEFYGRLVVPLPPITYGGDEEYRPLWQTLRIASSARFGTFVSAGFSRPAGDVGKVINKALGGDPDNYSSSWGLHASYLGSRGAIFDLSLDVESADDYGLDMELGIVPDTGRDRGYIRVDEHDRDTVRRWFRADTRLEMNDAEWVDFVVSTQSDPAVQSEFWEGDFERYERDESYVQWRRGRGQNYYDATVKARLDNFRSDVNELPSAGAYFGRTPIAQLGSLSLLHRADVRAAWLSRRAGTSGDQSPFSSAPALDEFDEFADGFGDREVGRFDFTDSLELPIDVGFAGLRATPFLEGRFTSWSEGENERANPTRFLFEAGARLGTTFWRRGATGKLHSLSPFLEFRDELSTEEHGDPVVFDATELAIGGNRLSLGLRGRLGLGESDARLDFEIRGTHATDLPEDADDGWLPIGVFARLELEPWGIPTLLWHDARYDLDDRSTPYALTAAAFRITEDLRFEAGHRYARDAADRKLLEAASVSAIYRWTEKWEFEGRETFSLMDRDALDTRFVLRRYGADMVFELQSDVREGEGGTSISVSVHPRFGWSPSRIGYLNY